MKIEFSIDELRAIITGRLQFVECSNCQGTGFENWNADGEDVRPGLPNTTDRSYGKCEQCMGVGYVQVSNHSS